jgi:hypothetical protein
MIPAALLTAGVALALTSGTGPKNTVEVKSRIDGKVYRVQKHVIVYQKYVVI